MDRIWQSGEARDPGLVFVHYEARANVIHHHVVGVIHQSSTFTIVSRRFRNKCIKNVINLKYSRNPI